MTSVRAAAVSLVMLASCTDGPVGAGSGGSWVDLNNGKADGVDSDGLDCFGLAAEAAVRADRAAANGVIRPVIRASLPSYRGGVSEAQVRTLLVSDAAPPGAIGQSYAISVVTHVVAGDCLLDTAEVLYAGTERPAISDNPSMDSTCKNIMKFEVVERMRKELGIPDAEVLGAGTVFSSSMATGSAFWVRAFAPVGVEEADFFVAIRHPRPNFCDVQLPVLLAFDHLPQDLPLQLF